MNFNEANNILKRIKREYKAFEEMEALIQFCVGIDQEKMAAEQGLVELLDKKREAEAQFDAANRRLMEVQKAFAKTDEEFKKMVESLKAAYADKEKELQAAYDQAEVEGEKRLAEIHRDIDLAKEELAEVTIRRDKAEAQYEKTVAKYEDFKRNL